MDESLQTRTDVMLLYSEKASLSCRLSICGCKSPTYNDAGGGVVVEGVGGGGVAAIVESHWRIVNFPMTMLERKREWERKRKKERDGGNPTT